MDQKSRAELVELGLSPTEAQVYLSLIENPGSSASAIATATRLSRTAVYQILCALSDKGLIESGAGYGSKFAVIAPDRGLSALIAHEEEALAQRKKVAETLSRRLATLAESNEPASDELIEIIRSPRAVAERFNRLQLEAETSVEGFVKPPFFFKQDVSSQKKIQRRGILFRGLYEEKALEDAGIKPHFADWVAAGEEARIYDGELPHKLAIFDRQTVLMPLIRLGEPTKTVLIRHPQLAQSLGLAFDHLWERSQPVTEGNKTPISSVPKSVVPKKQRISPNGRLGQSAKK